MVVVAQSIITFMSIIMSPPSGRRMEACETNTVNWYKHNKYAPRYRGGQFGGHSILADTQDTRCRDLFLMWELFGVCMRVFSSVCAMSPRRATKIQLSVSVVSDKVVYWFGVYFWFGRFRSVQVVSSRRVYIDGRGIRIHSRT